MSDLLYMEIDLRKIKSNLETIKKYSKKEVIPVIKSKAYAMGDIEVAKYLEEIGIKYAAVVDFIEALRLLENNIKFNILILNSLQKDDFKYLNQYANVIISINSLEDIVNLNNFNLNNKVRVHIQIDSGMNRLGIRSDEEYYQVLELIKQNKNLILEGIYTHFTGPENRENQEAVFKKYINTHPYSMVHCAASSTYSHSLIGNYVRVGLNMYGDEKSPEIKQSLKVVSKPLNIHQVFKGETIGYDQDYQADENMLVAVLPIGYSNGYRRSLRGFPVLVNGKRYKTVGKVCMNHLFVKVDESVNIDSEFIITSEELPIWEMAEYLKTVPHEILCMMNIDNKKYLK